MFSKYIFSLLHIHIVVIYIFFLYILYHFFPPTRQNVIERNIQE